MMGKLHGSWRGFAHLSKQTKQKGLFGFDNLHEPSDWLKLASKAVVECKGIIGEVQRTPASVQTIQLLDDISDKVCQVHDAAEFCKNVHTDADWQRAALQTCVQLGGFVAELNANKYLYEALCGSLEHRERISSHQQASTNPASNSDSIEGYTREALHVGRLLKRDFEKAGIGLEERDRQRIMALHGTIYSSGSEIHRNLAEDVHVRERQTARQNPFAQLYSSSPESRQEAWQRIKSTPLCNLVPMQQLADSRAELANLLGAKSYAEYALDSATLAGHPAAVTGFLDQLHTAMQPQIQNELQLLSKAAKEVLAGSSMKAWDRDLCVRLFKKAHHVEPGNASAYLGIQPLLQGFMEIADRVFGIRVQSTPLQQGEAWSTNLIKLAFSHPEEGLLGHTYIDPYCRSGKFSGCAHFTLRCRRQLPDGELQLPLVGLVFNFNSAILDPSEARTLFHELGHAMHSILSKTQFQHLAGTRGPLDMIEIPSHLFEHFLTNKEGLRICCRDGFTGERIPDALIDSLQQQWSFLPALKMNESVVHSLMDQVFHGKAAQENSLSESIAGAVNSTSPFPASGSISEVHHQLRFGHLVSYPASYYSYVYAQFIADSLWQKSFANDPLSRQAGEYVKTRLLAFGGSKEPRQLLADLLGSSSLQCIGGGWAPSVDICNPR